MQQTHDLMVDIITTGQQRSTRSGDVIGVFRREITHDMRKSLPLPMTKKLFHDGVVAELLMFTSGKSDRREMQKFLDGEFKEDRWDIWKPDCERKAKSNPERFNGYNLGEMYPVYWRQLMTTSREVVNITPRKDLDSDYVPEGNPSVSGVGINDMPGCYAIYPRIYHLWRDMLIRCYGKKHEHKSWRDQEVTVSPRWLQLSNFFADVYCLPGFQKWVSHPGKYCLDKDYFASSVYSRNTCIFLDASINASLSHNTKIYQVPEGVLFGSNALADHFGVSRNGKTESELMDLYSVGLIGTVGESNLRPKIFVDQLQNVVDQMKTSQVSRYMIVDNWNPNYAEESVLGACHMNFQVYIDVETNEFDLDFTLRSSDTFLGLPYNIYSYGLLMLILQKLTGLTPRFLYTSIKDSHIYVAHEEAVYTQLKRTPRPCEAWVELPDFETLDDLKQFTAKDFVLHDYNPDSPIKAPLLVG